MAQGQWGARSARDWRRKCWLAVQRCQSCFQVLSTLSLLAFLRHGRWGRLLLLLACLALCWCLLLAALLAPPCAAVPDGKMPEVRACDEGQKLTGIEVWVSES